MDNLLYEALTRYFTTLTQFGYKKYKSVYKLLFMILVEELLSGFKEYITEEDYRHISRAVNCVLGTDCLFPYERYCKDSTCSKTFIGTGGGGSSISSSDLEALKELLSNIWVIKPIRE